MARPARLLGFAVLSALLVPATQFASSWQPLRAAQGKEAQVSERLRWVGDRFLNGSRAVHPVTHQEPVPLDAAQIPGFLDTGDPLWLDTTQEPWDLDPLNGKDPKVELLLPADLGKTVPLTPQAGLKQDGGATLLEVEGQLEDGDQVLQDGSLYDLHTFEGEAGQFIEIRLSSDAFDTYLILVGPDRKRITENDDGGEGLDSITYIQLPQTGRYSVIANAYAPAGRGRYRLTVIGISAEDYQQGKKIANASAEADQLLQQGIQQYNHSQFWEALTSWEQALELYRTAGNSAGEGAALGSLGIAYERLSQYERAVNFHEQALILFRELGGRAKEGATLGNLGIVYSDLGQYERAIDFYEQWLTISRETGNRAGEGGALSNLGVAYRRLGQYEHAINSYEEALVLFRELGDRAKEGTILGNLGNVYSNLGQYERAISLHEQHLAIAREIGDLDGEGRALGNLGNAYDSLGQYERAIGFHEQHLTITREIGDRAGEGSALGSLGVAYRNLGQYERTINFHEQHLAISHEIGDRAGEGRALRNLGKAYNSLGQSEHALELYGQAVILLNELGTRAEEAQTLSSIGELLNDRDQPELAIIFLKASVKVREAIRGDIRGLDTDLQQSFTDTIADDYRLLADLLLQQDRILEAQRVLDLLKVQELDDYLRGVQRNGDTEQGVPLRPDEQAILDLFNASQDQLIALGRELDELDDIPRGQRSEPQQARIIELRRLQEVQRSGFVALLADEQVQAAVQRLRNTIGGEAIELQSFDDLRDNLAALEQNAVVLYPFVLDDRLELILVTPYGPPINRTVPVERVELNRVIAEFRAALDSPSRDPRPAAQQLYDWLIRPLAGRPGSSRGPRR
jgi:tetratricopeptide (TPR) repeat protein